MPAPIAGIFEPATGCCIEDSTGCLTFELTTLKLFTLVNLGRPKVKPFHKQ